MKFKPLGLWSNIIIRLSGMEPSESTLQSLPEEVREIFFFFFLLLLLNYMCNIYKYVQVFTYVHLSSKYQSVGGSAEQPQLVRDGRALSQPKPHPSDRIG